MAKKKFKKKRSKPGDSKWQPNQDQVSAAVAEFLADGGKISRLDAEEKKETSSFCQATRQSLTDAVAAGW